MVQVHVDGDLERSLKKFRNKVNSAGIMKEFKSRQRFVPKSKLRRKARKSSKAGEF